MTELLSTNYSFYFRTEPPSQPLNRKKPDQSWRYGIQTPLESQASFSAVDRDEDRVALGNRTSCVVTEAFNVLRFGTLLRVVSIEMRFFMYLGTLKTIALVDHCYDEISHILIAG